MKRNPTRRTPAEKHGAYFCLRIGGWMFDTVNGLRRWTKIEVWSRKSGAYTKRHDWLPMSLARKSFLPTRHENLSRDES